MSNRAVRPRFPVTQTAAALALAAGAASAQEPVVAPVSVPTSSVTVFGTLDLSLRYVANAAGRNHSVSHTGNTASKFGLRGVEALPDGLKASFWLESSIGADTGSGGSVVAPAPFWDRRSTVSLSGPFGEVRLGRDYTPIFVASAPADPFNYVGLGALGNLFSANTVGPVNQAFGAGARPNTLARAGNAVHYLTPATLGGFRSHAMVAAGEGQNAAGSFRMVSASAGYVASRWQAAAYGGSTRIDASARNFTLLGVNTVLDLGPARVSLGLSDTRYRDARQVNLLIGAWFDVGSGSVRTAYQRADVSGTDAAGTGIGANDGHQLAVGYVHPLSRRTALYATAVRVSNRGAATFSVIGAQQGVTPGSGVSGAEWGLRHNF